MLTILDRGVRQVPARPPPSAPPPFPLFSFYYPLFFLFYISLFMHPLIYVAQICLGTPAAYSTQKHLH